MTIVTRRKRRRGSFGLDERRRPDPERIEGEIRAYLADRLPDARVFGTPEGADASTRTLLLVMPHGHAALLQVVRDADAPGDAARALLAKCRSGHIPGAAVSSLAEGLAALRRFGIEPRPALGPSPRPFFKVIRSCRES